MTKQNDDAMEALDTIIACGLNGAEDFSEEEQTIRTRLEQAQRYEDDLKVYRQMSYVDGYFAAMGKYQRDGCFHAKEDIPKMPDNSIRQTAKQALEGQTVAKPQEEDSLMHDLALSLKRLSFQAQTSGGTAGKDEGLIDAIKDAEISLAEYNKLLPDAPKQSEGE